MTDETQPESAALSPTERTRIRRLPERAVSHRQDLYDVLDAGLLAHVGITDETGQTYVLPVAYARDGDRVVIHGSTGSRLFRSLASGAQACFSVTLVDGVVIARSAFESSLNYRSVMVLGRFTVLNDDEAVVALQIITDHLIPGRSAEIRENAKKELAATRVLALDLAEASVKIRTGGPEDDPMDLDTPVWAGVVDLLVVARPATPADAKASELPIPQSVLTLMERMS